jgi:hypothetical protein
MKSSKSWSIPFWNTTFWQGVSMSFALVALSSIILGIAVVNSPRVLVNWVKSLFLANTSNVNEVTKNEVSHPCEINAVENESKTT